MCVCLSRSFCKQATYTLPRWPRIHEGKLFIDLFSETMTQPLNKPIISRSKSIRVSEIMLAAPDDKIPQNSMYDGANFSHRDLILLLRHLHRVKIKSDRKGLDRITLDKR